MKKLKAKNTKTPQSLDSEALLISVYGFSSSVTINIALRALIDTLQELRYFLFEHLSIFFRTQIQNAANIFLVTMIALINTAI